RDAGNAGFEQRRRVARPRHRLADRAAARGGGRREHAAPGVAEPARKRGQVQPRQRARPDRGGLPPVRRRFARIRGARQRRRLRHAVRRQAVRRIPAPARGQRIPRHRHRPGQRAPGAVAPWWAHRGARRTRARRHLPLHASCRGRTARIQRGHSMSQLRTILLAEDSPHDAEMAIDALREANLANPIVHVEDGVEALDYLLRRGRWADRPDDDLAVLLLDIKMPRMDGLEVLTELRKSDRFKSLPIVVLSSSREESDLARSWDLGVNAYVVKPVDVDQFFDAVRTLGRFWAVLNEPPRKG